MLIEKEFANMPKVRLAALVVLVCTGMLFVISYLHNLNSTNALFNAFASTVLAIVGSIAASGIVFIGLQFKQYHGNQKTRRELMTFLGLKKYDWTQVAVVIPRFRPDKGTWINTGTEQSQLVVNGNTIKSPKMMNNNLLSFDDICAARHISSVFNGLGVTSPRLEFDDDIDQLFKAKSTENELISRNYKVFICVGLYSNIISMDAQKRSRLFRVSTNDIEGYFDEYKFQRRATACSDSYQDLNDWKSISESSVNWNFEANEKEEFGIIAKVEFPDDRTVIMVSGADSRGTRKTASYFKRNWEGLINGEKSTQGVPYRSKPFVFLGKLPRYKGSTLEMLRDRVDSGDQEPLEETIMAYPFLAK